MVVTIVLALLTGAAALAVLLPLARRPAAHAAGDADTGFYAAQLAEIDRDAARGLLAADEAEVARVEAARRLLAAERRAAAVSADASATWRRRVAALVALVGIPLLSVPLYYTLGQPSLPDQPLASRSQESKGNLDFDQAMARIESHLSANPEDGRGWEVVAPLYMSMGRYDDGVRAWASANRLLGETPARLDNWGEALVAAADGLVTAEARAVLDRALKADPTSVKSRFYRALGAEQDGDSKAAIEAYSKIIEDVPPGSPVVKSLAERITKLGGTPPAAAQVAALPPKDQMDAIKGMVEGLAARLAQDGSDVEGWLRLVRSYAVLNEPDKAKDALQRGTTALADNPDGRARLEALGRDLKIGGS
ncbi:c-type cytochrome biogenesis protein CcmI [uncultured Alsobacter sp.]|uniref:c-type cytochrome biogenesis protein CcmI n=1 Tax=uncultured Alsobacter sp. TaxID=1748258 RepID=UPI0025CE17D2|nr:c-type cytochrome biogenesis protein CcmI [uncultured Alsobacter sp.]